jgi:hypothetical protein
MEGLGNGQREDFVIEGICGGAVVRYPVWIEVKEVVAEIPDDSLNRGDVRFWKPVDILRIDLGLQKYNPKDKYRKS